MFGITRAPDFDRPGLTWFNTAKPLTLADLRGRIVILDFWTFCCINCIHVVPSLRRIEDAYPAEVAVIGVHTPKFTAERDPAAVAHAIARYDIHHPVVHDPQMRLWRDYAVRAWPTLVFISPDGYVMGELSGEPNPDLLVQGIGDMIRQFWDRGELHPGPLPLTPPRHDGGRLAFPGKIKPAPSARAMLWAVADAGHHQIVLLDDGGDEVARYGSGRAGFEDGADGSFNGPQGLAADTEAIWVADTGNHAIRRIDRASGEIATVAGVGARGPALVHGAPAEGSALASPWDVVLAGSHLYFANAGSHQIGRLDLDQREVVPVAGSGAENIVDGPAAQAQLAQPSGLALAEDGRALYFADSETSSIRRLTLDGDAPHVDTLVGRGLFEFGDTNGPFAEARLQHPLGLALLDGRLVVADSYNHRLRLLDLGAGTVDDLGEDFTCTDSICRPAAEPAGVAAAGQHRLLVSDTNNHRIVEYRLDRRETRTWFA